MKSIYLIVTVSTVPGLNTDQPLLWHRAQEGQDLPKKQVKTEKTVGTVGKQFGAAESKKTLQLDLSL